MQVAVEDGIASKTVSVSVFSLSLVLAGCGASAPAVQASGAARSAAKGGPPATIQAGPDAVRTIASALEERGFRCDVEEERGASCAEPRGVRLNVALFSEGPARLTFRVVYAAKDGRSAGDAAPCASFDRKSPPIFEVFGHGAAYCLPPTEDRPDGAHVFFVLPVVVPESGLPAAAVARSVQLWSQGLRANIERSGMASLIEGEPLDPMPPGGERKAKRR